MRERLVVIGNGMASLRFLEQLVARCPGRFAVTVIGAEPEPAYNRVLLSSLLADEIADQDCALRERSWYRDHGIRLILGEPAAAIDLDRRTVAVGRHTRLPFDRLVLASGSTPVRLPKPGFDRPGVVTFRDRADVAAICAAAGPGTRAVVIGGGLLGLEAATGLKRLGGEVTLLHVMDRLMERQLDPGAARVVQAALERRGIQVLLGADTQAVEGAGRAERVRLADGRVLPAELVVVAVGVRPNARLALAAGLACGRGVLVDDGLESSAAGVHALGECAEHRGQVFGLVEPCYEQAEVLARRLAGEAAVYTGSALATSLKVSGLPLFSAGLVDGEAPHERVLWSDPGLGLYRKLVLRDGRLVGALFVGDVAEAPRCKALIRTGEPVADRCDDLLFGPALPLAA